MGLGSTQSLNIPRLLQPWSLPCFDICSLLTVITQSTRQWLPVVTVVPLALTLFDNCCHLICLFGSDDTIHLSVVACGDRLEETLMMIKSTILFTQKQMHYHILADDELRPLFDKQVFKISLKIELTWGQKTE